MRVMELTKVAAAAEKLRLRSLARRQAMRLAFAIVAAVFLLAALAALHAAGWLALRPHMSSIQATLIVAAADVVLMAIFGALAARNVTGPIEQEAQQIRIRALVELRASVTMMAMAAELASLILRAGRPAAGGAGLAHTVAEIVTRVLRR
jgi:membrane protein YdbS with pleckstrin-like domain